jgi:hypothetical protein
MQNSNFKCFQTTAYQLERKMKIIITIKQQKTSRVSTASDKSKAKIFDMDASLLEGLLIDEKGRKLKRVRMMVDILKHRNKGIRIEMYPTSQKKDRLR